MGIYNSGWRMEFWGDGCEGNMRYMFDTIRRPDLYGDIVKPRDG